MSGDENTYNPIAQNWMSLKWWGKKPGTDIHGEVVSLFQHLRSRDSSRYAMLRRHQRLYGNLSMNSDGVTQYGLLWSDDRVRMNLIKAAIDVVTAKIIKNKPRPQPLTSNGNWSMRRKAKFLQQFFDAQFYISGINKIAPQAFMDACVFGTGILFSYVEDRKIVTERVWPGEMLVDELDGLNGKPRGCLRWKLIDREVLYRMFPDKTEEVRNAGRPIGYEEFVGYDSAVDQVIVIEGWRLPTREGAGDGRHTICVNGGTLLHEEWKQTYLPFTFIRWSPRLRGFWGIGLSEELTGIQLEINKLLLKVQQSMNLMSTPRWLLEEGSRIVKNQINNRIGEIVYYRGTKPEIHLGQSVHPETFMQLDRLWARGMEIAGVSPMAAAGVSKNQPTSGAGLRTKHDIETERFVSIGQQYEELHLELARQYVELAKSIGGKFAIQSGKYTLDHVDWSEIDMDRDAYYLQVFPSSSLPSTPAGRLDMVIDMMNAGLLNPEQAKRLLDFPDLDADLSMDRAAADNIDRVLECIIDDGEAYSPEPFMDLNLALKKAQDMYNKVEQTEDVPEERIEYLRQFMTIAGRLQKAAMAEQQALMQNPAPGAPPPPGPNGAPPMAANPSDGSVNAY